MKGHGSSVLVATVSSAFGVLLLNVTMVLSIAISADDVTGGSESVQLILGICAIVFMAIAIFVSAIVTSNTFATIIAGRTRSIALMRLLGSTAAAQRRAVAREGLMVGLLGALLGAAAGTAVTFVLVRFAVASSVLADLEYSYISLGVLLPLGAVALTTVAASWVGSRRVLVVTPMQAIGGAEDRSAESLTSRARTVTSIVLMVIGFGLLLVGVVVGLQRPDGVLIALPGGMISFTGLVLGSHLFMPPALSLVGRILGRSSAARLAAKNALRYPERSSRSTIGIVIGVTLITMFGVATESYRHLILEAQTAEPETYAGVDEILNATVLIFSVLIGFSALIAAIGMVNALSLSVLQRTRELGLLRALGFTAVQVRGMIRAESAQLAIAAVAVGITLGVFYGWAGAQSLLGGLPGSSGLVVPAIPWLLLLVIVVAAGALTLLASLAPARRATRVSPIAALTLE